MDAGRRKEGLVHRTVGCVLLLLSMVFGLVSAAPVLIAMLAVTQSRAVSIASGVLVLAGVTGLVALRSARLLVRRREPQRVIVAAVTCVTTVLFAVPLWWLVLQPGPETTPPSIAQPEFWDLPTGSRIAYEAVYADGGGLPTPVILVHGGPGSPGRDTAEIGPMLATAGFDVYNYHQVGAGLSSRLDADDYTVSRHVADLEAIRIELKADHLILIGASWGGQLIAGYIATYPERVERAVVSSPGSIWAPAFDEDAHLTTGGRRDQQGAVGDLPRFQIAHILMNIVGAGPAQALLPDRQVDGVFEAMVKELDMWAGCKGVSSVANRTSSGGFGFWVNAATTRDARDVPDPRPQLAEVAVPLLVLRGECDYLAWEVAREYRDLLPNAILVPVDAAGHVIQQDQPELYRDLIRAFVFDQPLPVASYTGMAAPW